MFISIQLHQNNALILLPFQDSLPVHLAMVHHLFPVTIPSILSIIHSTVTYPWYSDTLRDTLVKTLCLPATSRQETLRLEHLIELVLARNQRESAVVVTQEYSSSDNTPKARVFSSLVSCQVLFLHLNTDLME